MKKTMCTLIIDGREITVPLGEKVLWAALDNDIFIPNLCAIRERKQSDASCRLCFVEVEGYKHPVTSCTLTVTDGMVVQTRSPRVDRLLRTAFELLLSDHRLGCARCPSHRACELQRIAKKRGLKLRLERLKPLNRDYTVDESPADFAFDRGRCVLCGRCVWMDRKKVKAGILGFAGRGLERRVTTFNDAALGKVDCTRCKLCVETCPVGALYFKGINKNKKEEQKHSAS